MSAVASAAVLQFPLGGSSSKPVPKVVAPSLKGAGACRADILPAIREAYAALAAVSPGFSIRDTQLTLSQYVYEACVSLLPLAAEAPTGTGKTLAYLIGALVASRETGLPVVVATATVALQQQIVNKDLAHLRRAHLVSNKELALMVGRGRYFCQRTAQNLVDAEALARQGELFDFEPGNGGSAKPRRSVEPSLTADMLKAYLDESWRGDRDTWDGADGNIDKLWPLVSANADTCSGKSCNVYEGCRYFRDRARATTAKILITNHNLVLADLKIRSDGGEPLFPYERYAVIFDEAHQLPAKACEAGTSVLEEADLHIIASTLPEITDWVYASSWLQAGLRSSGIALSQLEPGALMAAAVQLEAECLILNLPVDENLVFGRDEPPGELQMVAVQLAEAANPLLTALAELSALLRKSSAKADVTSGAATSPQGASGRNAHLETQVSRALTAIRRLSAGALGFCSPEPLVRWVGHDAVRGHLLTTSPMDGGELLAPLLWDQHQLSVVLTSATLRTLGTFNAFRRESALPAEAVTVHVDSTFKYHESQLDLYALSAEPGDSGFEQALAAELAAIINPAEGTLVLFTNVERMRRVLALLPSALSNRVLIQRSKSVRALVQDHCQRLDRGEGSILFGSDTFSEGIDLPGAYCTHVVITQLPFPQFGRPLDEARRKEQGTKHFNKNVLPAVSCRLNQAVGRLLRRETDKGRVSILDVRIRRHRYGDQLLMALPPFVVNKL